MDPHTTEEEENDMGSSQARQRWRPSLARRLLSPSVLTGFLVVVLWMGIRTDYSSSGITISKDVGIDAEEFDEAASEVDSFGRKKPDFGQYVQMNTLTEDDFGLGDGRRLIVIGDIHGMDDSFEELITKLDYEPQLDKLVHLGDIVAKGPHSLRVLSRMAAQNMTGVRGNHDQNVIQWRTFMNWVKTQKGGQAWFDEMVKMNLTPKQYKKLKQSKKKFPTPDEEWGSEHWDIAKKMSREEYDYLRSLPLVIHIPILHTYLVHAGLLPVDPTRSIHDSRQPLTHVPSDMSQSKDVEALRTAQELSLLSEIKQNRDPWNKLNMRDVTRKGKVSRKGGDGTPWSDVWNNVQNMCKGFDKNVQSAADDAYSGDFFDGITEAGDLKKKPLSCYPTTVIYGHAAKRGLDLKRWSKGLDSGCVYGRRLTTLVFGDKHHKDIDEPGGEEELEELRYGDSYKARIVSVKCPSP